MPIFEYRCRQCLGQFEKIESHRESQTQCPQCGTSDVIRLVSSFSVVADGSRQAFTEAGPCACGAPRRGMCGE